MERQNQELGESRQVDRRNLHAVLLRKAFQSPLNHQQSRDGDQAVVPAFQVCLGAARPSDPGRPDSRHRRTSAVGGCRAA